MPPHSVPTVDHQRSGSSRLAGAALAVAVLAALTALVVESDAADTALGAVTGATAVIALALLLLPLAGRVVARRVTRRGARPADTAESSGTADEDALDRLEPLRAARRDDA